MRNLPTVAHKISELEQTDRSSGRLDLGTASKRVVKLGEYLDFSDAEMNKGYCRSLHTFEWFPDINAELRFPVTMLVPDCTRRHAVQGKGGPQRELLTNAMVAGRTSW